MPTKLLFVKGSQPSRAVRWFLQNNHITDIEAVELSGAEFAPGSELSRKTIYQAVPLLEFEDGSVLTESSAIINYLATTHNKRGEYPEDPLALARIHEAQLHHDTLARRATTRYFRFLVMKFFDPSLTEQQVRDNIKSESEATLYAFNILNQILSKQTYIAGKDFTVADYNVICDLNQLSCVEFLAPQTLHLSNFPNIVRYLEDAKKIPGYDTFLEETKFLAGHIINQLKCTQ